MKKMLFFLKFLPSITINVNGKPYLTRYYLFGKDHNWGNVFVHHFHTSDQGLELHSHPWKWGLSFVFSEGYVEERAQKPDVWERIDDVVQLFARKPVKIEKRYIRSGTFNFIRSCDYHRVDLMNEIDGAWTLFITGPRTGEWGFLNRETSEFTHWSKNPEAIP